MTMRIKVEYRGLTNLERHMAAGGNRSVRRAMVRTLREAARIVAREAKGRAPFRTGRLQKAIATRVRVRSATDAFARIGLFKPETFYGRFLEIGFVHKGGRHVRRPFLEPALSASEERIAEIMARPLDPNSWR